MGMEILDYFTGMDERLLETNLLLADIVSRLDNRIPGGTGGNGDSGMTVVYSGGQPAASGDKSELRRRIESGSLTPYRIITVDNMSGGQSDQLWLVEGDFVHIWTDGPYDDIGIRLNDPAGDIIYADRRNPIANIPFWKLYLTYPDRPGHKLDIMIGRDSFAQAQSHHYSLVPSVNLSTEQSWTNPAANPALTLDCAGRDIVEFWVDEPTGGQTVKVYGSLDNTTFHETASYVTDASGNKTKVMQTGYRYVKVEIQSVAAGAYEIEISAAGG